MRRKAFRLAIAFTILLAGEWLAPQSATAETKPGGHSAQVPDARIEVGSPTLYGALLKHRQQASDGAVSAAPIDPKSRISDASARSQWAQRLGSRANTLVGALSLCNYESPTYDCVRNVGVLAVLAYKASAGDREAFADFDAGLTALGIGGALLGQGHWSAKDTIGWWWGAGAMGVVYDELSNTKARAQLYGLGAEATERAISHSEELHDKWARFRGFDAGEQWTYFPANRVQGARRSVAEYLTIVCDENPENEAVAQFDKATSEAILKYRIDLQVRCAALRAIDRRLQFASNSWAGAEGALALGLKADLLQIDMAVSRADQKLRARSTDVAGVIVRSAANVLANLAVKLTQADATPVSYTIQRSGITAETLTLHGLLDCQIPDPPTDGFLVPDKIAAARSARPMTVNDTYLASLARKGAALNEIATDLNARIAAAQDVVHSNGANTYQFRLGDTQPPPNG